jgi:dihydroorotate dehydrogenase (NAD+) catalytic subunit
MSDHPSFLGIECRNRSILASGILGVTLSSLKRVYDAGAGIVTSKSIGTERRKGHRAPVVYDWGYGLINSVGLSNPGIDEFVARFDSIKITFPLIVSIFGHRIEDFSSLAEKLESLDFPLLELNLSCPNVLDEFGTPFSFSEDLTEQITRNVKDRTSKKVIVKLSPNAPNVNEVAQASARAGADALCVMNTLGPGMVIHTQAAVPVLGNRVGGISGGALLPLTVKKVYDLYGSVSIPLIGTGGVSDADGALQLLMAGAHMYGVGSVVYSRGIEVFKEIEEGIEEFLHKNRLESSGELIGLAHRQKKPRYYSAPLGFKRPAGSIPFTVVPLAEVLETDEGGVKTLLFDWKCLPPPVAGQFFMLWIPDVDQKPFSVSYYDGERIGFSVVERGTFSTALCCLDEGHPLGLLGPLGKGFDLESHKNYLLVGGGIGIAPLLFSAVQLVELGRRVTLLAGGRDLPALGWAGNLLERSGIRTRVELFTCTEDGSCGRRGVITDFLKEVIEEAHPDCALLCGPELFMAKALDVFRQSRLSGEASIERMMKCGIGICGSCCLDENGDRVCLEGPVFSFDYLYETEEFGRYRRDESGGVEGIG